MRVKIYCEFTAQLLEDKLNKLLEQHEGDEPEIQYQCYYSHTGYEWFSAMVIFKGRGAA